MIIREDDTLSRVLILFFWNKIFKVHASKLFEKTIVTAIQHEPTAKLNENKIHLIPDHCV